MVGQHGRGFPSRMILAAESLGFLLLLLRNTKVVRIPFLTLKVACEISIIDSGCYNPCLRNGAAFRTWQPDRQVYRLSFLAYGQGSCFHLLQHIRETERRAESNQSGRNPPLQFYMVQMERCPEHLRSYQDRYRSYNIIIERSA